jgi:LysM repeat protein
MKSRETEQMFGGAPFMTKAAESKSRISSMTSPERIRPEIHSSATSNSRRNTIRHGSKKKKTTPAGFWIALFSWIIALTIISGNLNETFSLAEKEPAEIHIQVEAGDTLWRIAQDLNDTVFENAHDVRYLIYVIEEANGLKSAIIHPGQTLVVPLDL